MLRPAYLVDRPPLRRYVRDRVAYYPYYSPTFVLNVVFFSPYGAFGDCALRWVHRERCCVESQPIVYVDTPVYNGHRCRGWRSASRAYYLASSEYTTRRRLYDAGAWLAVRRIEHAWRAGDISTLTHCTDPGVRIAVYDRARYTYSLPCDDYLDMTRDAMRSIVTVGFDLSEVRMPSRDYCMASVRHRYRDDRGAQRTTYVSFALRPRGDDWLIAQVRTALDHI